MAYDGRWIEASPVIDNQVGESAAWSAPEQALYWINCEGPPQLHRWRPADRAHDVWPMAARIGGLALKRDGGVLVVLADGLYDFDPASGRTTPRLRIALPPQVALHETICDRQGRLWVGGYDHAFSPANRDVTGATYFRLDGDALTPVIPAISVANGLAVSPDGRTLYASNSPTRRIWAFDLDPATGDLSNRRVFLDLPRGDGYVDGAATDAEGGYWLAAIGRGQLRRYTPQGAFDRAIDLPFSCPTKLTFGGPDLDEIYVTSAKLDRLTLPGVGGGDRNGGLYVVKAGVKGLEEPLLAD
jgi:sugar lactone lactonase YvrE